RFKGLEASCHTKVTLNFLTLPSALRQAAKSMKSAKFAPKILATVLLAGVTVTASAQMMINGAGATFPYPIYSKWFDEYAKVDPSVRFNYQSIGSGGGQKQILAQTVDFGASDGPMSDENLGNNTSVKWPAGIGGKGNEGVSGQVKQTPGAIGYVELIYATQNKMPYAEVKNTAGEFVKPSLESITAALSTGDIPEDFRFSITNAPGKDAYPICGATWLLVYEQQKDAAKGKKLVEFLKWAAKDGEKMAKDLQYAPLPDALQQRVLK